MQVETERKADTLWLCVSQFLFCYYFGFTFWCVWGRGENWEFCLHYYLLTDFLVVRTPTGRWPRHSSPRILVLDQSHPLATSYFLNLTPPWSFRSSFYFHFLSGYPLCRYLGPPGVVHSGHLSSVVHFLCYVLFVFDLIILLGTVSFLVMSN